MKITSLVTSFVLYVAGCIVTGCITEESPESEESANLSGATDPGVPEGQKPANVACAGDPGSCVTPLAVNDGFVVSTTDGCGRADFVDFGPGAPGGGDNDDYIEIHDFCADSHGVKAFATLFRGEDVFNLGSKYNGNGLAGSSVIWDPFKAKGNVEPGDTVELTVCLVDGANDPTPFKCETFISTSVDG